MDDFENPKVRRLRVVTVKTMCAQCKLRPVAYAGARFCGAACVARHEAHEKPNEVAHLITNLGRSVLCCERCGVRLEEGGSLHFVKSADVYNNLQRGFVRCADIVES
jgi:hypothetical protein